MTATIILIITAALLLLILIIYLIGNAGSLSGILKSTLISSSRVNDADMVYYLPAAMLQVTANATVVVVQDPVTRVITKADLFALDLQNAVSIIPDTEYAIALSYVPSAYSSDDIKLGVDSSGLMQSIDTTTDDKIADILAEVAGAPAGILQGSDQPVAQVTPKAFVPKPVEITSSIAYNKVFNIPLNRVSENPYPVRWRINVSGDVQGQIIADASFKIKFPDNITAAAQESSFNKEQYGVFSRPMETIDITVTTDNQNAANEAFVGELHYSITIPNRKALVLTPVQRSPFVKRINLPKFSSGMLVQNEINKPSQFESVCNVPVNVGKALASIPARLFTFTVQNKSAEQIESLKTQLQIQQLQKQLADAQVPKLEPKQD